MKRERCCTSSLVGLGLFLHSLALIPSAATAQGRAAPGSGFKDPVVRWQIPRVELSLFIPTISSITKAHSAFVCSDIEPTPTEVPVQKLMLPPLSSACVGRSFCSFTLDGTQAEALGISLFQIGLPSESYAETPGCTRLAAFEYGCRIGKTGPEEKRYAVADLSKGLPVAIPFTCGTNYAVPSGIDPKASGETGYIFPIFGRDGLARRLAQIRRSRELVKERTFRFDAFGVSMPMLADLRKGNDFLGRPFTVGFLLDKIKRLTAEGKLPADEKPNVKDIRAYECPDEPGLRRLCSAQPARCPGGIEAHSNCVFPLHQYEALLPEFATFMRLMWHTVLKKAPAAIAKSADRPPAESDNDPYFKSGGTYFYNFACRTISKMMPGFAKIERKAIPTAVQIAGDWEQPVPEGAPLEKEIGRKPSGKKGAASKTYEGPPKKDEVVEICTVTHPQLEWTLKKDLGLLAAALPKTSKPDETASGISSLVGLFGGGRGESDPFSNSPDPFSTAQPTAPGTVFIKEMEKENDRIRRAAYIDNESFNSIADRLVGFYRKAGKARVFKSSVDEMRGTDPAKAKKFQIKADSPAIPESMRTDVDAQNRSVDLQNNREVLRREIDQWTDGWEYTRLSGYLNSTAIAPLGLFNRYKAAEQRVAADFWGQCEELWDVCKGPQTRNEIKACAKCAYRAIFEICIDGKVNVDKTCSNTPTRGWWDSTNGNWYSKRDPFPDSPWVEDNLSIPVTQTVAGKTETSFFALRLNGGQTWSVPRDARGATLRNWVTAKLYQATTAKDAYGGATRAQFGLFKKEVFRYAARHFFMPIGSTKEDAPVQSLGYQYLEKLPLTPWQKCFLWSGTVTGQCELLTWRSPGGAGAVEVMFHPYNGWPKEDLSGSPLFNVALVGEIAGWFSNINQAWDASCYHKLPGGGRRSKEGTRERCSSSVPKAYIASLKQAAADVGGALGFTRTDSVPGAGGLIADALGPIAGKLIGYLIKGDIESVMKVLAKAAGLTPEQAVDCEDPEYRTETMKLAENSPLNNKRGCLTKVFSKNFVDMLEQILVMVGNKLVDWAVDAIRAALEGVKIALVTSAGSVPFVGGLLASAVEVAWEVLMNFGAKALLKGLVVSQLPTWLKVKDLAGGDLDKLIEEHPIIALVAGIILDLIMQALTFGDKGLVEVGFASVLNIVQGKLQENPKQNAFWIRAFIFAKKELIANSKEGASIGEQVKNLLLAMAKGIAATIGARMDPVSRPRFEAAIARLLAHDWAAEIQNFQGNPLGTLAGVLGRYLIPVAIPVITAFVSMSDWVKQLLDVVGRGVEVAVNHLLFNAALEPTVVKSLIAELAGVVRRGLIEPLSIASVSLRALVLDAYDWVTGFIVDFETVKKRLEQPLEMLKSTAEFVRKFAIAQVGSLVAGADFGPERNLLESTLNLVFDLLTNDNDARAQSALFEANGTLSTGDKVRTAISSLLLPYVEARLCALVRGTGLESLVSAAVRGLLHPRDGLIAKGSAFFKALATTWLPAKGHEVVGTIADAVAGVFESVGRERDLGSVVVAFGSSILRTASEMLFSDGGLSATGRGSDILRRAKDALLPVGQALAESAEATLGKNMGAQMRLVVNNLADLYAEPAQANWSGFVAASREAVAKLTREAFGTVLTPAETGSAAAVARALGLVVEKLSGRSAVAAHLGKLAEKAIARLDPAQSAAHAQFLGLSAKDAFAALAGTITESGSLRALLARLTDGLVDDGAVRTIASGAIEQVVRFFEQGLGVSAGTGDRVKAILSNLLPEFVRFLRERLLSVIPNEPKVFKTIVRNGFEQLASLVTDLVSTGSGSAFDWRDFTDAKKMLAAGLGIVLESVADFAKGATDSMVVKALIDGGFGFVKRLIANWDSMIASIAAGAGGMKTLFGFLVDEMLKPFLDKLLPTEPGIARTALGFLVDRLVDGLRDPGALLRDLQAMLGTAPSNPRARVKKVFEGLLRELTKSVGSPALQTILTGAVDFVKEMK